MKPLADWAGLRELLCIRLDNMGDVLMTTPAIRALKSSMPGARITLMASRSGAQLAPFLPDIDEVISYDAPWVKNDATGYGEPAMIDTLRERNFDAAVIFTVYTQSALPAALICHLAGITRVLAHCRENPYRLIDPWVRDDEPSEGIRHEVQRQLDLVASIGAQTSDQHLSFALRTRDRHAMHAVLRKHGLKLPLAYVVAHCGASAPSRRYSPAKFAQAFSLMRDTSRPILLTGNAQERELTAQIIAATRTRAPVLNLAGELTLGELACVIDESDLLISNNTGPVHIAAAVRTPVVDVYALTNPQHGPWQVPHRTLSHDVACKYCYRSICPLGTNACLEGVDPHEVASAADKLLQLASHPVSRPVAAA
jgi:lipopolysaccharide heptosyltransferase II